MNSKAIRKQLLAAVAMVLVAAVALSSSTYAWFAANNKVSATNMQVTATTSQSLVITNSAIPTASTGTVTVASSDEDATALIPATHDSTWATYTTGLKYNTNPGNVSASTGLVEAGKGALEFATVEGASGTYYKDYTVYIAASGGALDNQKITVTLRGTPVTTLPGATSIDFYYGYVTSATTIAASDSTYAGTLNLAGINPASTDGTGAHTSITLGTAALTIPQAGATSGNKAIAVTMRVYVDGALHDSETTTYVKNVDVAEVAGQTLAVDFVASSFSS